MLIHLESGSCPSGVDETRIDGLARSFYRSIEFTTDADSGGWIYICNGCERECSKLSGLFQHVEDALDCGEFMLECLEGLREFIEEHI
jgi:hypothetical protein